MEIVLRILSPEEMEREEIRTIKEILKIAKPVMDKNPHHRAYIPISDIEKLFPSQRIEDRYEESILNNLRKYFRHYNKKYCTDGVYYHVGTALSRDGEKIIFVEERNKEKVQFTTIEEATIIIGGDRKRSGKTVGGVPVEKLSEEAREKLSQVDNT